MLQIKISNVLNEVLDFVSKTKQKFKSNKKKRDLLRIVLIVFIMPDKLFLMLLKVKYLKYNQHSSNTPQLINLKNLKKYISIGS